MFKVIRAVENSNVPFLYWLVFIISIILFRNLLEAFSSETYLYRFSWFFVHYPLFYLSLFCYLLVLFKFLSGEKIGRIFKLMSLSIIVILLPPLIDLLFFGLGGAKMRYISAKNLVELGDYFFTFFGSPFFSSYGITAGIKCEILLIILLSALYIFVKTKSFVRACFSSIVVYTTIFFFVSTPFFKTLLTSILKNLGIISDISYLSFELYYILLLCVGGAFAIYLYDKKIFRFFVYEIRPLRVAHFLLMFFAGIVLGVKGNVSAIKLMNSFDIFFLGISICFLWVFSVITNDIFDIEGDKESERQKPLARRLISVRFAIYVAGALFFWGLAIAALVDYKYFALATVFTLIYWVYSAPPLRLKRFPFVSTFLIANASLVLALMGNILAGARLVELSHKAIALIIVCFTLAFNAKDLKDIKTDKINNLYTLPVLFGEKWGKIAIGIACFVSFMSVPFILGETNGIFIILSLFFGFLSFVVATMKRILEWLFFVLYFVYVFVIFVMMRGWERLL